VVATRRAALDRDQRDSGRDERDVTGMSGASNGVSSCDGAPRWMVGFAPMRKSLRTTAIALSAASFLALLEIFRTNMSRLIEGTL
jgi:hypothetical protein